MKLEDKITKLKLQIVNGEKDIKRIHDNLREVNKVLNHLCYLLWDRHTRLNGKDYEYIWGKLKAFDKDRKLLDNDAFPKQGVEE